MKTSRSAGVIDHGFKFKNSVYGVVYANSIMLTAPTHCPYIGKFLWFCPFVVVVTVVCTSIECKYKMKHEIANLQFVYQLTRNQGLVCNIVRWNLTYAETRFQ